MSNTNPRSSGWLGLWCLLVGVILLATGLFFVIGGYKLVSLGGSWYFLIAGVITLLAAIQFFRRRSSAVWLFALVFVGTLIWALFDAGFDFWPLVSRLMVPAGLMLLRRPPGLRYVSMKESLTAPKGHGGSALFWLSPWASPLFRCFSPIPQWRSAARNYRWCR
ncbi:quinate/shikimate dehydrogenase (pyrroloquinoline-quinone) [Klebsiella variicola]|uniref:Quinate/shikimate dehydrogenase (Pyrroloquinoline-quinone) n=1 Tax=Klebsiella variicola TaxID=244366 RepID=A0A7H4MMC4_KLEVA|nr:quinate/shikimate dehydrogenase (pyrroloquinoline-quinone) [Klebsiella variicola]